MGESNKIKVFEDKRVRMEWSEEEQDWYLSIVDVVEVLTGQPTHDGARKYWSVVKSRLKKEGSELTTICSQLKMQPALSRETDPLGMTESEKVAKQGGSVAKAAREQYEKQSGKNVVTALNAKDLKAFKNKDSGNES